MNHLIREQRRAYFSLRIFGNLEMNGQKLEIGGAKLTDKKNWID
jgi:hypothetical protein